MIKNVNVTKDPVTTIVGLVLLLLVPTLVFFGVLTPEQKDIAQSYLEQLWSAYQSHQWASMVTVIAGIIGLFSKDKHWANLLKR